MLIGLTLFAMFVLMMFSVIIGSDMPGNILENEFNNYAVIDGIITTFDSASGESVFLIDPVFGAIGILIVFIAIAGLVGIQILGSGLSDASVRIITASIIYGGLWAILSVLAMPLIFLIEVFGSMIYVALTLGFLVGVVDKLFGGDK